MLYAQMSPPRRLILLQPLLQGDAKIKSVEELLNEASSLLSKVSNGETIGESIPTMQQSVEELEQLGYVCDESGCVLVLPHERESAKGEPCESSFVGE